MQVQSEHFALTPLSWLQVFFSLRLAPVAVRGLLVCQRQILISPQCRFHCDARQ